MEYAILVFALLAILHFLYEGILAPSYRLEYAYKVFQLRDELRMLKIRRGAAMPEKHFHYVQDSMNGILRNIELIDIVTMIAIFKKIAQDKEFRARAEERIRLLESCPMKELTEIRNRSSRVVERVLTVNNGAWGLYLIPIAIAMACYKRTAQAVKWITSMSEPDIEKAAGRSPGSKPPMKLAA